MFIPFLKKQQSEVGMATDRISGNTVGRKPSWLKKKLPRGKVYGEVETLINDKQLHTVCREAKCPNQWECFSKKTATFLIMGNRCSRECRFCAVAHGPLEKPDSAEPERIAAAAEKLNLNYVVVTSVTRDDLADGGASCFAEAVAAIRFKRPAAKVEVLIPDFKGSLEALRIVVGARPNVINHNLETVAGLYPEVRPGAVYRRSLGLIEKVGVLDPDMPVKSGLMLGLGESYREVKKTLQDLLAAGCRLLTLGQYLQPTQAHLPVQRFVTPEEFDDWHDFAIDIGFLQAASGPFVRSSYQAEKMFKAYMAKKGT
jgi:lipoic acid synthetase